MCDSHRRDKVMSFPAALNKLWATTPKTTREEIIKCAGKEFTLFGMDDPLVICHFMAQISHESGNGKIRRESLRYSASRIMEVFGVGNHSARVTEAQAKLLAYNEKALAERVYGLGNPKKAKELGNTEPGDGFKYRGNGFLQLTGRASHRIIGQMIDVDLENNPDALSEPKISFMAACAEFKRLNCIPAAEKDNIVLVTRRVNGGRNGLAERTVLLRKWKEAMDGVEAPAWAPRAAEIDKTPKLLETRTGQIATGTGIASAVPIVSQIGEYASSFSDTVSTVKDNGTSVVEAVKVVKPFLGMSPHVWMQISIGASVAVMIGVIAVLIYRYLKIRNRGE